MINLKFLFWILFSEPVGLEYFSYGKANQTLIISEDDLDPQDYIGRLTPRDLQTLKQEAYRYKAYEQQTKSGSEAEVAKIAEIEVVKFLEKSREKQ